jgi:transcriptional regulator with XRE-family HTH domain
MSNRKKIQKSLSFDEISEKIGISPQQVHKIEKEATNKMFSKLCNSNKFTPFEVHLGLSAYLGIEPEQLLKKLDNRNKRILFEFTNQEYGKNIELPKINEETNDIEELFK